MNPINFCVFIAAGLLPLCNCVFTWGGLQPQGPQRPGRVGPFIDSQNIPHTHDAVLNNLTGFIQVKASMQKNARSIAFDLSNLQTYLKEVDHQIMDLQSQVASLQQAKQTLDIIKNAFGGSCGSPGVYVPSICPPCPSCDITCPPPPSCPPPPPAVVCPSVPLSTTKRPLRSRTTPSTRDTRDEFEYPDTSEESESFW